MYKNAELIWRDYGFSPHPIPEAKIKIELRRTNFRMNAKIFRSFNSFCDDGYFNPHGKFHYSNSAPLENCLWI